MDLKENIENYLKKDPYGLTKEEKNKEFLEIIKLQIDYHLKYCRPYNNWYQKNGFVLPESISSLSQVPFIPSSAFKHVALSSTGGEIKTIKSSGTTSQLKSEIYLDTHTSKNQTIALSKILSSNLDKKRKHFFIVDIEPNKNEINEQEMTARYAGMQGYLMAAKSRTYLMKSKKSGDIEYDIEKIEELRNISNKESVVIIGYTYMIWQYLINTEVVNLDNIDLKNSKLIHFGGWKKLTDQKVSKEELVDKIKIKTKIQENNIFDIYGFTEQLGTVYVSRGLSGCRSSAYSEVLVRDINSFEVVEDGKEGFLQFISILPLSYPGFSILNDDIGNIVFRSAESDKTDILEFEVLSRLEKAESRGCGDTLPDNYYI